MNRYTALEERASLQAQLTSALSSLAHMNKSRHPERAEAHLRRALSITETALGADHPQMAICLNNLGMICMLRRKLRDAQDCFERACTVAQKAHGHGAPEVEP